MRALPAFEGGRTVRGHMGYPGDLEARGRSGTVARDALKGEKMERILITPREVETIRSGIQKGMVAPDREETDEMILLHCPERDFLAEARIRRTARVTPWEIAGQVFARKFDPAKIGLNRTRILHLANAEIARVRVLVFESVTEFPGPEKEEPLTLFREA